MSTVALGQLLTIGLHRVIVPSVFHSHRSPLLCVRRERGGRVGGWCISLGGQPTSECAWGRLGRDHLHSARCSPHLVSHHDWWWLSNRALGALAN